MMRTIVIFAFLGLAAAAPVKVAPAAKATPLLSKKLNGHVTLTAAQQQTMHSGCVNACKPSPVESKCVTACEAAMYKCIDETGPTEDEKDTKACHDKTLKLYEETKGIEKAAGNSTKGNATEAKKEEKKAEKKAKAFIQLVDGEGDADSTDASDEEDSASATDSDEAESDETGETDTEESEDGEASEDTEDAESDETGEADEQSDDDQAEEQTDDEQSEEQSDDEQSEDEQSDDEQSGDDEAESFVQVSKNIDDDNAEAAEMAKMEDETDKLEGEDDSSSDDEQATDEEESFVQVSKNIDDDNAEAAEMAKMEDETDKLEGEDDSSDSSDDEQAGSDESFVQVSKNIDDDNAEAAEMAKMEDETDKLEGEDDSSSDDEQASDEEESLIQTNKKTEWKPEPCDELEPGVPCTHLYEHPQGSTVVMPCPVERQTAPESCRALFGDKADGQQCPQITCPKALGVTMKLICGGGCCPSCWAPDHVVKLDRHTTVDDAAVVDPAPQAAGTCSGVKCFELKCAPGFTKGFVNGDCCYSCVQGR